MNMESFKRFVLEALDRGGGLALVLGCLALYLEQYSPNVLGPVSVGLLAVGVYGLARYIIMDCCITNENAGYKEPHRDFERFSNKGEHLPSCQEHREPCFRCMSMKEHAEAWRIDLPLVEDRITDLERLLQAVVEISSCASRTLDTLKYMRARRRLSSGTHSEDIALVNNVEDKGQTDTGNMQQEEKQTQQEDEGGKRQEKIRETLLEVEHLSEEALKEQLKITKKELEDQKSVQFAAIALLEERVKKFLMMKVAKEVLKKLIEDKDRRTELFEKVFEAEKRRLQEESAEEVLGEVQDKKMVKITLAKVIAKGVLKELVADNDLMQEIIKIVLKEAAEDLPGVEVVRKVTLEEVVEEVLKNENLIEDVFEQIFIIILRNGLEIKEEEKLETVKKMLETELVKEVTEKEAAQKMPVEKVSDEMLEVRYRRENTSAETLRNLVRSEPEQKEEKQKIPAKLQGNLKIDDGKIQNQQEVYPEISSVEIFHKDKEEELNIQMI